MPTLAAIDVGSNGIRLIVGKVNGDRNMQILENIREAVRLGQDVFTKSVIAEETIDKAAEAFARFKSVIAAHDVKWTKAIATSAVREAQNKDLFVDRMEQASGITINVVDGEEEAVLIHLAVASKINLKNKRAILVDIGGGSTEVTLVADGQILSTESYKMGTVRLLQLLEERKHGEKKFGQLVREYVDATQKRMKKELGAEEIDVCVGTGGNIEALGALRVQLFDKERSDVVQADELDTLVKKLQSLTYEERIQQLLLRPDRADVIVPASIVIQKLLKRAGVDELQIPSVGLKDGLLIDMMQELYGEKKISSRDQVLTSALQLGRKFSFDEQHGLAVGRYATRLFDETRNLHNLPMEYRLLLEVAAMLHDIGHFINMIDHHKHTLYLLTASPVIGLSKAQMAIVANVARYHRKSLPKPQHEAYSVLSSKERVIVSKLAAILRLADAMDNEHATKVEDFTVEYKKPKFILTLKGEGDLLLEKWALMKKAAMFEEVYSVKLSIND
ncbi:MAG: Ppx/GppA family phosphatase [Bacteroidetes bacterium]|nr:Ppx/GppA family phosphatase [Bacteroidota bacterium]MCW5894705.1 Ppx/GppA family phosphatase [Bacteroidota bacterium]